MAARLQEHYTRTSRRALKKEFGYKNAMEVPKIDKVVINMGVGEAVNDPRPSTAPWTTSRDHRPEAGRHKARKSIATFKLREGMPIGAMVTLRGERM